MREGEDERNVGVINRNQRNQSMSATRQAGDHVEHCSPTGSDYVDYAHESVSAKMSNVYGPSPPTGTSLQHLSALEDLLSQREDVQNAQDLRDDAAISVINRNQRNQLMLAATQAGDHIEQSSPKWTDYADYADYTDDIDYVDYADYANESVSAYWTQTHEPDPPPTGAALQYLPEARVLLTEREDIQGAQDHRVDYAISVINRNQRNQSDLPCSQPTLRVEKSESDSALH